jgi:hypothetical protein
VVEHQSVKHKALNSNASTTGKKIKKNWNFKDKGQAQWFMSVIPATQESGIGRITVQD